MSEYGVQDDGTFRKKPVDQIREDAKESVANAMGWDVSQQQENPAMEIVDALSIELARQWDASEASYYASFYEDTFGEQLDKQLALAGFSRLRLRAATGEVTFSRDDVAPRDIDIPQGTVVTTPRTETRPPIPFETTESATIFAGDSEATEVPIEALKPWQTELDEEWLGEETNVQSDTITRFEDPISGVDSVTNPLPTGDTSEGFVQGRDEESDAAFKLRYENTLAEGGVSTPDAMQSSIFRFDEGIESVRVEEVRNTDDGYGPEVTVLAPTVGDDVIAQAVYESRGAGLESFGAESGTATTDDGRDKTESFERATRETIYVDATLTTSDTYPDDGETRIENNIIRFIGGEAHDGINYPGLEIGEDVVFDQVKKRIMEVRGVVSADVTIGTADDPTASDDIAIANLEVAMTGIDEIDLTEV